jgi:hypothetical protein
MKLYSEDCKRIIFWNYIASKTKKLSDKDESTLTKIKAQLISEEDLDRWYREK